MRTVTAKQSGPFIERVWDKRRWSRGSPRDRALKAWREKLKCAGPENRVAMKKQWRESKRQFYRHRHTMRATRCGEPSCNLQLGWLIAHKRGISRGEFDGCLVPLWDRESGWDEEVWNEGGSGAGGIPQALPASKMGADANPDVGGWRVAEAQIDWGLDYLAEVHGGPCGGWEHSNANGWY